MVLEVAPAIQIPDLEASKLEEEDTLNKTQGKEKKIDFKR